MPPVRSAKGKLAAKGAAKVNVALARMAVVYVAHSPTVQPAELLTVTYGAPVNT
ncbi:hypothetical protein KKHFBJBL_02432 [Brevundimonas sp. NIBR11]|nr:hypothetical protein KKHFBJBL_02432 [Brevundimonas sp. NIBR11]